MQNKIRNFVRLNLLFMSIIYTTNAENISFHDVAYDPENDRFVAVGTETDLPLSTTSLVVSTSKDGISWVNKKYSFIPVNYMQITMNTNGALNLATDAGEYQIPATLSGISKLSSDFSILERYRIPSPDPATTIEYKLVKSNNDKVYLRSSLWQKNKNMADTIKPGTDRIITSGPGIHDLTVTYSKSNSSISDSNTSFQYQVSYTQASAGLNKSFSYISDDGNRPQTPENFQSGYSSNNFIFSVGKQLPFQLLFESGSDGELKKVFEFECIRLDDDTTPCFNAASVHYVSFMTSYLDNLQPLRQWTVLNLVNSKQYYGLFLLGKRKDNSKQSLRYIEIIQKENGDYDLVNLSFLYELPKELAERTCFASNGSGTMVFLGKDNKVLVSRQTGERIFNHYIYQLNL